jgi:hypothetical protein
MERYLIHTGKTLQRLAEGHAVPAGSQEVTGAFILIKESIVFGKNGSDMF